MSLNSLLSQVQHFRYNDRLHTTTSHFHWKLKVICCSLHTTGYLRLRWNQWTNKNVTSTTVFYYINIEVHMFTASSPVSSAVFVAVQQASYDHQSLPLETDCHSLQSPHNWILEADVKQTTMLSQLQHFTNFTLKLWISNLSNTWCVKSSTHTIKSICFLVSLIIVFRCV